MEFIFEKYILILIRMKIKIKRIYKKQNEKGRTY